MAFLTYRELRTEPLIEQVLLKSASVRPKQKIVFLSHSSEDNTHLAGVVNFFSDFNAPVYVDIQDTTLPTTPSHRTASIIKNAISACPRFVILVSPNSYYSNWIPWELGFADSEKGVSNIALLPIAPTSREDKWIGYEYLSLYPRILKRNDEWRVYDTRDNKYWTLLKWLRV